MSANPRQLERRKRGQGYSQELRKVASRSPYGGLNPATKSSHVVSELTSAGHGGRREPGESGADLDADAAAAADADPRAASATRPVRPSATARQRRSSARRGST